MRRSAKTALAAAVLAAPAAAAASDTVSYTYDALGRVTDVATAGGPNDGSAAATRSDPAGNRTSYGVAGAGPAGSASASPSSSSGDLMTGRGDEGAGEDTVAEDPVAEEIPAPAVEPPPAGGIPDESEPVVEIEGPGQVDAAGAAGAGR